MRRREFITLLGGAGEQRWRDGQAECLCSHHVDGEIKYGRKHDGQIGWAFTLQDAASILSKLPVVVCKIGAIAH